MSSIILETKWNVVVNLGVKCNTLGIARKAKIRYFSSPFDNMDSVAGIVNSGKIIKEGFSGYFDNIEDWRIKNDFAPRTEELRAKLLWHKDSPDVFYPHFNEAWLTHSLTPEGLKKWKSSTELEIAPVWDDFREVYKRRSDRLIGILKNPSNKILFLRVDEAGNLRRATPNNTMENLKQFMQHVSEGYPDTQVGLLYLYMRDEKHERALESTDNIHCIEVPKDATEDAIAEVAQRSIQLLPPELLAVDGKPNFD